MKNKFILIATLLACMMANAQEPEVAQITTRGKAAANMSSLDISNLERIQFCVNDQNQVQSIFVFEDQTTAVFDNVEVVSFQAEEGTVEIDNFEALTDVNASNISIYPNPTTEVLQISGMGADSKGAVFNLNGQRVCTFNGTTTTLNVSGWANGTYLIRIDNSIFKLIKQ
jgi:hypothetical protein